MSALDRAFIKAFAKDASREQSSRRAVAAVETPKREQPARGAHETDDDASVAEVRAETIPIVRERRVHSAAALPVAVVARPMTNDDRRAFERFHSEEFQDIISIERELAEAAPPPPENQRRTDEQARAGVPSPHFVISSDSQKSSAPKTSGASIASEIVALAGSFDADLLPPPIEMPAIPLPANVERNSFRSQDAERNEFRSTEPTDESAAAPAPAAIDEQHDDQDPSAEASAPFTPVWEVDRFVWPAVCDKLLDDWSPALDAVGASIDSLVQQTRDPSGVDHQAPIVAVVSFGRGEGRTTTAACLARSAAQAGLKTVLIDGDFENPQLASVLGLNSLAGWEDVMLAKLPLEEAAVLSIEDQLTLLPALRARAAAELYGSKRIHKALASIAAEFDLVVLDVGPIVEDNNGPFKSASQAPFDAAVLVRDLRWTTESQLQEAAQRLEELDTPVLAVIENFAESRLPALAAARGPAKPHVIRE